KDRGEYKKALKLCKEAKKIFEEVQDPIGLLKSCYNIWEILKDDKSYEDLINAHDLVRERASTIPASIETLKLKDLDIFLIRRDIAEEHIDLSEVVEHYVTIGDLKKAYGAHLRNKNLASIELLRFSDFKGFKSLKGNERVLDLFFGFEKFGYFYEGKFYELKIEEEDFDRISELLKEIDELLKSSSIGGVLSARSLALAEKSFNNFNKMLIKEVFKKPIFAQIMKPIEYYLKACILHKAHVLNQIVSKQIEKKCYELLEAVGEVFSPFFEMDSIKIVPAYPMVNFPFHLLRKDGKFLYEVAEVTFLPHADFANVLDSKLKGECDVVAYSSKDPLGELPQLKMIEKEAEIVSKYLKNPVVLKEPRIEDLMKYSGKIRVLHVASHAVADLRNVLNSRICLGESIHPQDIFKIKPSGFVFLSACETGVSEKSRRDSLGLHTAILASGAKSILATLWPVGDDPAFEFAEKFYSECKGEPSYEAYVKAIDHLRRKYEKTFFFGSYCWYGSLL
ncbi:MAG: CHAT domain-containing protein, partial [Archaeoglobaceae archaeon]|nr:CHAT domain-containing protein [Archaeoglobaceae archaeon]